MNRTEDLHRANQKNQGRVVSIRSSVIDVQFPNQLPEIQDSGTGELLPVIAKTSGIFFLKAVVFATFCYVFSRYFEAKLTQFFGQIEAPPEAMIEVVGISFMIAAIAGLLGFSVAIGAFFAGLVFSRDPDAVKFDASFESLYALFTPFFFIGIGLKNYHDCHGTGTLFRRVGGIQSGFRRYGCCVRGD
ncbi:MAG: cation:proton antiporter [Coleofasciculus sp. G3-WIS-01]|uniref:cation:proton antiporter domain-containing protein n=1 Tax=Coleofasciculus sp. G3-WIS-01 TaxID=3069528 RepID=UPI0032F33DDA